MLLAAEDDGKNLEVLSPGDVSPGDPVRIEGSDISEPPQKQITIDDFFAFNLTVKDSLAGLNGAPLVCGGKQIKTGSVREGKIG